MNMGNLQDPTLTAALTPDSPITAQDLGDVITPIQDEWITYRATGGLMVVMDESVDGNGRKGINQLKQTTITAFARERGVDRSTLYEWQKTIPDFNARVEARRRDIFTTERMALVWNGVFMRAAKGDAKQAEMIASHFSDYVPPAQRIKVEAGDSMFDLMNHARRRLPEEDEGDPVPVTIQEGEVVSEKPAPSTQTEPLVHSTVLISTPISTVQRTSNILTFDPLLPTTTHEEFI